MQRLAQLRLEGAAAGATETEEHDGLSAASSLGSGDSSLLVDLALAALPLGAGASTVALVAELQAAFDAGALDKRASDGDPPLGWGEVNPPAAIVTTVARGGRFPLYRYPAAGGTAPLIAAQQDWSAAPLVAAVRDAADAAAGTASDHAVINYYPVGEVVLGPHTDKTLDLTPESRAVVVNIGSSRWLQLSPLGQGKVQRIRLHHGCAFVIGPETNRRFTHEVRPEPGAGPRISVTLRKAATLCVAGGPVLGLGAGFRGLNYPTDLLDQASGAPLKGSGLVLYGTGAPAPLMLYVRITLRDAATGGATLCALFDRMAAAERPGGPETPGGTLGYSLWKDCDDHRVFHKLEIFTDAAASNSVFAYPEVPAGIVETEAIVVDGRGGTTPGNELHWLGEGHLQPPEVTGPRYAVAVGWYAGGGRAPEPMVAPERLTGLEPSPGTLWPPTVATVRFLQAADGTAAAALEAAAGRVCTAQAQGIGARNLRLASLHRRCTVGDPTPTPAADVPQYQFVWVTIERPPSRPTLALPARVSEAGPNGKVVLCRGAGVAAGVGGATAIAEWASGFLPRWPS
eukprot:SAG11_NODE_576_length_8397_cov_13.729091_4_plen_571_part_00